MINYASQVHRLSSDFISKVGEIIRNKRINIIDFIDAGRPKAALLFWFFGYFRCGALLFMVIHVIYKYKNK